MQNCDQTSFATCGLEPESTAPPTLCPVNNSGSTGSGDSVVVSLPEPSDSADACLGEEVHGKVAQALLGDHYIRLVFNDFCTDLLDVVLLQLQQCSPANVAQCCVSCSSTLAYLKHCC